MLKRCFPIGGGNTLVHRMPKGKLIQRQTGRPFGLIELLHLAFDWKEVLMIQEVREEVQSLLIA